MRRLITLLVLTAFLVAPRACFGPARALAQADAKQAFDSGKAAYSQGQFAKARDLFLKASQTDNRNPEAFLWLGKAHYQLGELDAALAAWRKTVQLAPQEPYATAMLKALGSEIAQVDSAVRLAQMLRQERQFPAVLDQCARLLADKALTDAQRTAVLTLKAEVLVETGKSPEAIATVGELLSRPGVPADAATTTLLLGQARLQLTGLNASEALAALRKVVADYPNTPAAATAQYELIVYALDVGQNADADQAEALRKWIASNPKHFWQRESRVRLIEAYLGLSSQQAQPQHDAKLGAYDQSALAVVAEVIALNPRPAEVQSLGRRLLTHLDARYGKAGAYAAAIDGAATLAKLPLGPSTRQEVLRWVATYSGELALRQLTDLAKAGKLPDQAPLPQPLADAVAAWAAVSKEFPAIAAWKDQAALAERVRALAALVPWPPKVTQPKAPYQWAVQVALPIVKADADDAAVAQAVQVIDQIVIDCAKSFAQSPEPPARGMALAVHGQLLAALSPEAGAWAGAMLRQIDLLDAAAKALFQDNVQAGQDQANAQLSDPQKELLAAMGRLVTRQADQAANVFARLGTHLKPWLDYGHYALAEQAYETLVPQLPPAQRREVRLAVVELRVRQASTEHDRLLAAGQNVPHQLHPAHVEALRECFVLQDALTEGDPFGQKVRQVWDGIARHYKSLEYFDLAEQAIGVRPPANPAIDTESAATYAQLQLANLHYELARRELDRFLSQYGAAEKVALSPAFKTAIADFTKFVTDHPKGPWMEQAVGSVFSIAQIFEQHHAYDVSAGVYRDFAAAAAKVKVLAQAAPGAVSTVDRAELAVADTLYAKALHALQKAQADLKPGEAPPAKLSPEFAAAVAAYQRFIQARPAGLLGARGIGQIMAAALEYAKVGAWDVADGVYAGLLKADLSIRRPERIELCRGLCQLGQAMPDHARQVLAALTTGPQRTSGGAGGLVGGLAYDEDKEKPADTKSEEGSGHRAPPATKPPEPGEPAGPSASATTPGSDAAKLDDQLDRSDALAMVAIRKQQERRASQIAALRDQATRNLPDQQPQGQQAGQEKAPPTVPVLSDAEIARQAAAIDAAYKVFQGIRKNFAHTPTAQQARGEIVVMVAHWRSIAKWERAAALMKQYLADNPIDIELPQLRLSMARDTLAWASQPIQKEEPKSALAAEVAKRFAQARSLLADIVAKSLADEKPIRHQAQWDIANSFLTQARVVNAFSPTLARGQYVRAAKELLQVAAEFHDHPDIAKVPQMLWSISTELAGRGYHDEAITVWGDLTLQYPTESVAQEAAMRIAQTYQNNLGRPLKAAEAYLELNFARGGSDQNIQNAIYQIGSQLKNEKRWVEALHVLGTFVDSFPRHASAGQALTMVGQIHQTNEAWADAIAAYRRVINEFPKGAWVREAKWSIAECTINLSRWQEAIRAYESYLSAYGGGAEANAPNAPAQPTPQPQAKQEGDSQAAEAQRRIGVLKDLARYQALVDEKGQRKAFDAQFQIAQIVLTKLSNPVKAIIEFRKVATNWPESHLADDALYQIGQTYQTMGETDKARTALLSVAEKYPNSPLADDALYAVGQSYESEAEKFANVTRAGTIVLAQEKAQKFAYKQAQSQRDELRRRNDDRISQLRKGGKDVQAELEEARGAVQQSQYGVSNTALLAEQAEQQVQAFSAKQLADRQDKINAALRKAVAAYQQATQVAAADKAGDALLRMAVIYADDLKDPDAAMKTYLEIVRQFSGTSVAEDASWRIAQYYELQGKYADAIDAYKAFLRNYRRSEKAGAAQFAIAEDYEHLGKWVEAMDAYTNYINNFAGGPLVPKAKEQINWIKTYRL